MDLSGNGNNAGVGVAPTWDAVNGWKFNGTTQYLTTTFVPQTDQSQSFLIQFTNLVGFDGWIIGARGGIVSRIAGIQPNYNVMPQVRYWNGNGVSVAPPLLAGHLAVAGDTGYRNGVSEGAPIPTYTGAAIQMWIGARNNLWVAELFCQVYVQAMAFYDCTLTAPQVAAVAAAMAAL